MLGNSYENKICDKVIKETLKAKFLIRSQTLIGHRIWCNTGEQRLSPHLSLWSTVSRCLSLLPSLSVCRCHISTLSTDSFFLSVPVPASSASLLSFPFKSTRLHRTPTERAQCGKHWSLLHLSLCLLSCFFFFLFPPLDSLPPLPSLGFSICKKLISRCLSFHRHCSSSPPLSPSLSLLSASSSSLQYLHLWPCELSTSSFFFIPMSRTPFHLSPSLSPPAFASTPVSFLSSLVFFLTCLAHHYLPLFLLPVPFSLALSCLPLTV